MSLPFKRQFGVADFKNLKVWQKAHAERTEWPAGFGVRSMRRFETR
jgi:hypothetical protein